MGDILHLLSVFVLLLYLGDSANAHESNSTTEEGHGTVRKRRIKKLRSRELFWTLFFEDAQYEFWVQLPRGHWARPLVAFDMHFTFYLQRIESTHFPSPCIGEHLNRDVHVWETHQQTHKNEGGTFQKPFETLRTNLLKSDFQFCYIIIKT